MKDSPSKLRFSSYRDGKFQTQILLPDPQGFPAGSVPYSHVISSRLLQNPVSVFMLWSENVTSLICCYVLRKILNTQPPSGWTLAFIPVANQVSQSRQTFVLPEAKHRNNAQLRSIRIYDFSQSTCQSEPLEVGHSQHPRSSPRTRHFLPREPTLFSKAIRSVLVRRVLELLRGLGVALRATQAHHRG